MIVSAPAKDRLAADGSRRLNLFASLATILLAGAALGRPALAGSELTRPFELGGPRKEETRYYQMTTEVVHFGLDSKCLARTPAACGSNGSRVRSPAPPARK